MTDMTNPPRPIHCRTCGLLGDWSASGTSFCSPACADLHPYYIAEFEAWAARENTLWMRGLRFAWVVIRGIAWVALATVVGGAIGYVLHRPLMTIAYALVAAAKGSVPLGAYIGCLVAGVWYLYVCECTNKLDTYSEAFLRRLRQRAMRRQQTTGESAR